MNPSKTIYAVCLSALIILPLHAFGSEQEEIAMLDQSAITLTDAIESAESHLGGRALSAEIEDDSFSPRFEVTLTKDGKVFDVEVDGESGKVLGVREDRD